MVKYQVASFSLFCIMITGCSSYQAQNKSAQQYYGYKETLLNKAAPNRFALAYYGEINAERKVNTQYWHQRAKELCPTGYRVLSHSQFVVEGVMQSKTSGNMVSLAELSPVDDGEIMCQ